MELALLFLGLAMAAGLLDFGGGADSPDQPQDDALFDDTDGSDDGSVTGTAAAEVISGNSAQQGLNGVDDTFPEDTISGFDGDDTIYGGAGNDSIAYLVLDGSDFDPEFDAATDAGNDMLFGGDGDDVVMDGTGDNTFFGGIGDDELRADAGNDSLNGGAGNDGLDGGAGNDSLDGGAGNDGVHGGRGDDSLIGGAGNDTLFDYTGNNTMHGDAGDDAINGGDRVDLLYGGADNDYIIGHDGNDLIYGGAGNDSLGDRRYHLINGTTITDYDPGLDTIYGDDGDDVIIHSQDNSTLFGGAGQDTITGGNGSVNMFGDDGNDLLYAGTGTNTLDGGAGNDTLFGGGGFDEFGGGGIDHLTGGTGNDVFVLSDANVGVSIPPSREIAEASTNFVADFMPGDKLDLTAVYSSFDAADVDAMNVPGGGLFFAAANTTVWGLSKVEFTADITTFGTS